MGNNRNVDNAPLMGAMPTPSVTSAPTDCADMENPIFLTRSEVGALFNAIGFCVTSVKGMQCVVQEPALSFLLNEEMEVYCNLRTKLFHHLQKV